MTAEGSTIEHQHRQAFRSRIDGGRETCGTRSDDRHIIDAAGVDGADHADTSRKFDFGRIAQHLSAGAHDDRQLREIGVKPFKQRFGFGIGRD